MQGRALPSRGLVPLCVLGAVAAGGVIAGCPEATRETPPGTSARAEAGRDAGPPAASASEEPPAAPLPTTTATILAPGAHALALAVCGDAVYYASVAIPKDPLRGLIKKGGSILTVPVAGGPSKVLVGNVNMIEQLTCGAGTLYATAWFGTGANLAPSDHPVVPTMTDALAITLPGGPSRTIATTKVGKRFAIDGEKMYLASDNALVVVPLKGGKATELSKVQGITQVALDDQFVFAIGEDPDAVWKVPKAGGDAVLLVDKQMGPRALALDAEAIYWTNSEGDAVMKMPKGGGAPVKVARELEDPGELVLDGETLYFSTSGEEGQHDGSIMKCPKKGCGADAVPLVVGLLPPMRMTVDATSVYWTNDDGEVLKAAK